MGKTYDKQAKSYVFALDSNSNSRLQFPKDEKHPLALLQQYLVLQIFLAKGKSFALELTVADSSRVIVAPETRIVDPTQTDIHDQRQGTRC